MRLRSAAVWIFLVFLVSLAVGSAFAYRVSQVVGRMMERLI